MFVVQILGYGSVGGMEVSDVESALRVFGKSTFRLCQRELIECALHGRSCLGVMPTGFGKSLCYQLPAWMMPGITLVISPLIALMKDQVASLKAIGVSAARFDFTLSAEEKDEMFAQVLHGMVKILFLAPESLESAWVRAMVSQCSISMLVVDEAHCLSEWGHSFRPDYLSIPGFVKKYGIKPVMTLTATATKNVCDDLCRQFEIRQDCVFRLPPYRSNIWRGVKMLIECEKFSFLSELLRDGASLPAIVYVRSRKDADELAAELIKLGISAKSYHAGMNAESRFIVQNEFLNDSLQVMVATIAFGMGIDKANVRMVVHYHPPTSIEAYVQESGRAGRDGEPAKSWVMLSSADVVAVENRLYAGVPDREGLYGLLSRLARPGQLIFSNYEVTTAYDLPETTVEFVLYELKNRGFLHELSKGYKYYKVRPLFGMEDILCGRANEEISHLRWLNEHREGEVMDLAIQLNLSWSETCHWLDEVALSGEWKVEYRQKALELKSDGFVLDEMVQWFDNYVADSLFQGLARWKGFLNLWQTGMCQNRQIDIYFGFSENAEACAHCASCVGELPQKLDSPHYVPCLSLEHRQELMQLLLKHKVALGRPSQLVRFLLGISTPASLRARLWNHPLYGSQASAMWGDLIMEAKALFGHR